MADRIFLEGLRIRCRVGIGDAERSEPQEIVVDASLTVDLRSAGVTDSLDDTIDYAEVMQRITEFATGREFRLLESLAEGIAGVALQVSGVEGAVIKVRKSKYSDHPSIGVEIERDRDHG